MKPSPTKTVTVTLRISPEEHAAWIAEAGADDRSLSSWVRRRCNEGLPQGSGPTTSRKRKAK